MSSSLEEIPIGSQLTSEQARAIFGQGEEAVVFALLELRKQLAEAQDRLNPSTHPSTPSGMIPAYQKPPPKNNARGKGKKRPGAQKGHPGQRREKPDRVDRQQDHRADKCPDCGGGLNRCSETRKRYTEDIADTKPEVTEHTIHRDWCPKCQKKVEPIVTSALPGSCLGNSVLVLSAWMHYALGNTLSQIIEVFNFHLQIKLSQGGLVAMWQRLQGILYGWYEEIQQQALQSAHLHADETGWRVNGKTHWLWCFCTEELTYYMIDRSRGSPALEKFFIQEFQGTLITDFWAAYNAVDAALRQTCLVHLLRELEQTEKYKSPRGELGTLRQKAPTPTGRCHTPVEGAIGDRDRGIRLTTGATGNTLGEPDRYRLEQPACQALDKETQATSRGPVDIPASGKRTL